MPAAAVIPAPQVYSYTAEVKKLVVGSACAACGAASGRLLRGGTMLLVGVRCSSPGVARAASEFTLNKLECSTQASRLYTSAWNNGIGPRRLFCWFPEPR